MCRIEQTGIRLNLALTQVEAHADEHDQAEPGVEVSDEVDDGNDNIGDGREDAEDYIAIGRKKKKKRSSE